jgi:hypothetical protein
VLVGGHLRQLLGVQVSGVCKGDQGGAKGLEGGVRFTQLSQGITLDGENMIEVVV